MRLVPLVLLTGLALPLLAVPAQAASNDYPYRGDAVERLDAYGFTTRQCTSFVAWRLDQHDITMHNASGAWGDAWHWDNEAKGLGMTISLAPRIGAVAMWNAGESGWWYDDGGRGIFTAGPLGHVAYVSDVYSDGTVQIEQYNAGEDRGYSTMRVRAPRYLYL